MSSVQDFDMAYSLVDFFGCSLHQVNQILLRIGLEADRPEWLRGVSKLAALPRWSESSEHVVSIPGKHVRPKAVGERVVWVVEELRGGWKVGTEGFVFENVGEALHFKLRWS